tara:strand:+ start:3797 stop:4804 length:1008 start_codon:yes stop_codon:yes gene_type:complete
MKTLTEQYRLIKEDKGHKGVFLKEAKKQFPNLIRNAATFKEASTILKQKGIISENYVDLQPINNPIERKKEGFENAFEKFLAEAEAKAEEKKVSKEVEEDAEKNYDMKDKKDPNNMIFGQIQMGYYCELKDPKNEGKTDQELLEIVYKNLAKDSIYYTKNGQFGEQDLGYTDDAPSLGPTEEPKGEHKSSGYGKIKEHSISMAGGIVTGGGFTSMDYREFYGLDESSSEKTKAMAKDSGEFKTNMADASKEIEKMEKALEEDDINEMETSSHIEAVADILSTKAEEILQDASDRGEELSDEDVDRVLDMVLDISEIRDVLKSHLNLHIDTLNTDR